jgi:hypothetical protein
MLRISSIRVKNLTHAHSEAEAFIPIPATSDYLLKKISFKLTVQK